jgi:prepilin-type processing-associated H-X9-DG protein
LMMACHGGKANYALFDPTIRLPSGQLVELDIRIDQRPAVRVSGKATGKDGQIDLIASAALVDTLSNAKSFAITLRSGRTTKVYTFAMAQDPEALVAWCRLCGIKR